MADAGSKDFGGSQTHEAVSEVGRLASATETATSGTDVDRKYNRLRKESTQSTQGTRQGAFEQTCD